MADGIRRNATKAVTALTAHPGAPMRAMIFEDAPKPVEGKVFVRGNPNTKGADALRQFLSVLNTLAPAPFPKDKSERLELARAIASKDNPLTSRVIVNRVWNWHFGSALVGTPSDFGLRGDKPTNQPLLDYLAAWFPENGWSFKKLHKLMMLTAAHQSAGFAMRPLELEPFRDSVLAVSGRLKSQLYGKPDKVETTLRRTLYAFVDRRTPHSLYRSFDFPSASFSAPLRSRTVLAPRPPLYPLEQPAPDRKREGPRGDPPKDCGGRAWPDPGAIQACAAARPHRKRNPMGAGLRRVSESMTSRAV